MNTEISYKIWDKQGKRFLTDGYFMTSCIDGVFKFAGHTDGDCEIEPIDIVVCEYTGFKDKHGKKIFDGDFILTPDKKMIGRVHFRPDYGWSVGWKHFTPTSGQRTDEFLTGSICESKYKNGKWVFELHEEYEIIGNIYDKP